jgi:AcrR family transcriptional regulator
MAEALPDALRPRERILLAARDLFHRHGIRGVGVETIAEAAGTNKMTLYRHFDSKDDLIIAYLRGVAVEVDEMWRDFERDHPGDMQAQLKAWLICAEECVTSDERGCDLANAAVELTADDHPGRRIIEELKTEIASLRSAVAPASPSRECSPTPSPSFSKALASAVRPPAAKAPARNLPPPRRPSSRHSRQSQKPAANHAKPRSRDLIEDSGIEKMARRLALPG